VKLAVKASLGFGHRRLAVGHAAEATARALCDGAARALATCAPCLMGRHHAVLGHAQHSGRAKQAMSLCVWAA
jgi:hypothetical protein